MLTRENTDGANFRYELHVPEGYDPARRYPVRVYLHGGVSRPRRDEAPFWRNPDRFLRDDAFVVFPESWSDAMWWQANQAENLTGMLNDIKRRYNINENALSLLGVSDGATGVFYHAFKAPTPWASFLSFNGHPVVLANASTFADGQMYVTNLRNKPLFAVNGGRDRLYPIESVVPFLRLFVDAGVQIDFRPKPEAEHNMAWWDEESPNVDAFLTTWTRRPLPDRLVWETETTDRFNRAHWLVITELGSVRGETEFDDFNEIATPPPSAPLGFNMIGELDTGVGVQLVDIVPDSMAAAAGVRAGDLLVEMNGVTVGNVEDLRNAVQAPRDGPGLPLRVQRNGESLSFTLMPTTLGEAPPPRQAFPRPEPSGARANAARRQPHRGCHPRRAPLHAADLTRAVRLHPPHSGDHERGRYVRGHGRTQSRNPAALGGAGPRPDDAVRRRARHRGQGAVGRSRRSPSGTGGGSASMGFTTSTVRSSASFWPPACCSTAVNSERARLCAGELR